MHRPAPRGNQLAGVCRLLISDPPAPTRALLRHDPEKGAAPLRRRTRIDVGFVYTFLRRRRRSRPRPASAVPKIASDAGSGTRVNELENRVKLSGPSFPLRIVVSAVRVAHPAKFAPQIRLTWAAWAASRVNTNPTPPLPRFVPVSANSKGSLAVPRQLAWVPQPPSIARTSWLAE